MRTRFHRLKGEDPSQAGSAAAMAAAAAEPAAAPAACAVWITQVSRCVTSGGGDVGVREQTEERKVN